jgi:hypothetical protein
MKRIALLLLNGMEMAIFFLHGIPQLQNQTNISVLQWSATCIVLLMQEPAHL